MISFQFSKKIIVSLLLFAFLFTNPAPVKATGVEVFVMIIFAGKVYGYSSMAISAVTALASADSTRKISEEAEGTIEDYIEKIGERVEAADREAHFAETEGDAKEAMEKAAALRASQLQYINYLNAMRQNKAFVFKEILLDEAKGQAKGYIKGKIKSYILDDDALDAGTSIIQGLYDSGKNIMEGKTSAAITQADREFLEALKGGEATGIRVAITKAEWDKFVNTVAKEEFKSYLMGESETFKNLPLAIQEKYWQKLFLLAPDEMDEIHNIMKQARKTGNYFDALKEIIEKHPYYKNTFIDLTKDSFGSDNEWIKKIEEELRNKLKAQEKELEKLKKTEKEETPKTGEQEEAAETQEEEFAAEGIMYFEGEFHFSEKPYDQGQITYVTAGELEIKLTIDTEDTFGPVGDCYAEAIINGWMNEYIICKESYYSYQEIEGYCIGEVGSYNIGERMLTVEYEFNNEKFEGAFNTPSEAYCKYFSQTCEKYPNGRVILENSDKTRGVRGGFVSEKRTRIEGEGINEGWYANRVK